jgi:hypothetical protein
MDLVEHSQDGLLANEGGVVVCTNQHLVKVFGMIMIGTFRHGVPW